MTARTSRLKLITVGAKVAGDVRGRALAITLQLLNSSRRSASLATVVVNATDRAGTPLTPSYEKPARSVTGSLRPGASVSGVYLFNTPDGTRGPVSVTVSYSTHAKTVEFTGSLP